MPDQATELDRLKAKRDARKGVPGYETNVREIEARIAELEADENAE